MTDTYRCCPSCATGLLRLDPQTGEYGCGTCEARTYTPNVAGVAMHFEESPEPVPPPVLGGQGRDADELISDAYGLLGTVVLFAFVIAAFLVAAWAAGGGR